MAKNEKDLNLNETAENKDPAVDKMSEAEAKDFLKEMIIIKRALEQENEQLIKDVEAAKTESADFKDKWMRNVAEFDNFKKRNARLWQDAFNDGKTDVILKILNVGDNLERALTLELDDKTKEGVNLILKQFNATLNELGVEEINPTGQFDPSIAEAVMQVDASEGENGGDVKAVFQKGYKLNDKVIRYAKVSVIKQ